MTRGTTPSTATARRALTVVMVGFSLTACAHRAERSAAPSPSAAVATASPTAFPTAAASPTLPPPPPPPPLNSAQPSASFAPDTAVSCAGRPASDQVMAKVRTAGLVGSGVKMTVRLGPVCAGSWQYTIFAVTGREPLQVVTQGEPAALTLVTAGTDVCSTQVLAQAPAGIIAVAQCGLGAPPA